MHTYQKRFTSTIDYVIEQIRDDGYTRKVDENHAGFIEWTSSNTLSEIAFIQPILEELWY